MTSYRQRVIRANDCVNNNVNLLLNLSFQPWDDSTLRLESPK